MIAIGPTRALVAAAVASLTFTTAAVARDVAMSASVEVARVVVDYSDLDLETDAGARVLERRLVAAAREVCGKPQPRELRLAQRARACADQAVARAVTDVGSPRLAKLAAARSRTLRG